MAKKVWRRVGGEEDPGVWDARGNVLMRVSTCDAYPDIEYVRVLSACGSVDHYRLSGYPDTIFPFLSEAICARTKRNKRRRGIYVRSQHHR